MSKTLLFKGRQISYRSIGKGKPLVFLHGFLESSTIWDEVLEVLKTSQTIIAIDLPGHGHSSDFNTVENMADMAEIVKAVCVFETCQEPIVFGHSMGGYVALELKKIMDCEVALVHSNFWADADLKKQDRDRVVAVLKHNLELFVNTAIPNLFAQGNKVTCRQRIEELKIEASKMNPKALIAATIGMRNRNDNQQILENNMVAIIQGDQDSIIPKNQMLATIKLLKNKPIYIELENCGHMGFIEQKKQFLTAIQLIIGKFSALKSKN